MNQKIIRVLLIFVAFGFVFQEGIQAQDSSVQIRFAHFAYPADSIRVIVNQQPVVDALAHGEVTDWFNYVPAALAISASTGDDETINLPNFETTSGQWFTVVFTMREGVLDASVMEEDFSALSSGESRLTLFNAVDSLPALNVHIDGALFSQDLGSTESLIVPLIANNYSLDFLTSGEADTVIAELPSLNLSSQTNTFVAVFDGDNDSTETVIVETPVTFASNTVVEPENSSNAGNGSSAVVRVAHLSSGTPALDIYFDGELWGTNRLRFPEFTNWFTLPSGTYTVAVTLAGESLENTIIQPVDVTLNAGTYSDILLIGTLANDSLIIHVVEEDFSEINVNAVRVNLLNAHPGMGPVDLQQTEGDVLISRLAYPGFLGGNDGFSWVIVEAGTYDLQFLDPDGELWVEINGATFIEGRNYFISLISADPPFLLTFSDIAEVKALLEATSDE